MSPCWLPTLVALRRKGLCSLGGVPAPQPSLALLSDLLGGPFKGLSISGAGTVARGAMPLPDCHSAVWVCERVTPESGPPPPGRPPAVFSVTLKLGSNTSRVIADTPPCHWGWLLLLVAL